MLCGANTDLQFLKVILIADTFPPLRNSGAVQLRDLARELVRQGHDLTVLIPDPEISVPWRLECFEGARVLRLRAPQTKDIGYIQRTINEWLMPHAMGHNLRKSPLASERWDGIIWYSPSIFHGPLVRMLKRQSRCKSYLIIRDIFPQWAVDLGLMRRGPAYLLLNRIADQQYAVADIIGVQTDGNLEHFKDWQSAKPGRSLMVLQNWLGEAASSSCRIRIEDTALAGRKILVYAGNMGIAQGMDIVLELAARMQSRRDIGFLFVGRGSDASRLKSKAESIQLDNVLFFDEIDPDEIPDLYEQCHAGIVALDPRHRSHNIPGKFLTYMQCRLPVLANVNPGNDIAALIRSWAVGEVCETNDAGELQERCKTLIDRIDTDLQLRDRCGELFRDQFAVSQVAQQLIEALRRS